MSNDRLWRQYKETGELELRNELAEIYLPLVKIVCGRLAISLPQHIDKDDLLSSGFFGLLDAIERFDPSRQIKFETYAGVRIRGAMIDYLRSKDWLPVSMRQKIRRYEKTVMQLESELGREASYEEIASELGITSEELAALESQSNAATIIPLEEYQKVEEVSPSNVAEILEVQEILAKAIDQLPAKERLAVTLYYYEELTLKEISRVMGLTEARISQLHTKAIMRMRRCLAKNKDELR